MSDQEQQPVTPSITAIVDEYLSWYGEVYKNLFSADTQRAMTSAGGNLKSFLGSLSNEQIITKKRVKELLSEQENMLTAYEHLMMGQTLEETRFQQKFEAFIGVLRALERDCVLEDNGLDYLTGLFSKRVLFRDLAKQLEKLSRKGQPFSIAYILIDRYDDIVQTMTEESTLPFTRKVAAMIRSSIRSFDEAYRAGPGEFVIILQQSDITGGLAALDRLRNQLNQEKLELEFGEQKIPISLSSCVAEPVEHDTPQMLLDNLREDLKKAIAEGGNTHGQILQYQEISPLQRYVQKESYDGNNG